MSLIIEAILILTALFTIISYTWKGFIKSLFGVCKYGISFIISYAFSSSLGQIISNKFMFAKVEPTVYNWLNNIHTESDGITQISGVLNNIPDNAKGLLSSLGLNMDALTDMYGEQGISAETLNNISFEISQFVSSFISNAIAYACLFFSCLIVLTIVGFILDKIFSFPVLKTLNRFLGFVFGVVCAAVNTIVLCAIITVIFSFMEIYNPEFSIEALNQSTVIFRLIYNSDIITNIINSLKIF